jgi:hypothetical protein
MGLGAVLWWRILVDCGGQVTMMTDVLVTTETEMTDVIVS